MTTTAEAASIIRKELRATFPETKFTVRSSNFAGGSAVDIGWVDGPTERAVSAIANAQWTHTRYITPTRKYSAAALVAAQDATGADGHVVNTGSSPYFNTSDNAAYSRLWRWLTEWSPVPTPIIR